MKNLIYLLMAIFALTSCGGDDEDEPTRSKIEYYLITAEELADVGTWTGELNTHGYLTINKTAIHSFKNDDYTWSIYKLEPNDEQSQKMVLEGGDYVILRAYRQTKDGITTRHITIDESMNSFKWCGGCYCESSIKL